MKKLISSAAVALLAASAFAQGTVQFENGAATRFLFYDYPQANTAITSAPLDTQDQEIYGGPGVLDVGLFWSTSQFNTVAGGTLAGIENISDSVAGQLNGNTSFDIAGTTPGETVYMQCFAWDGSFGDSQAGAEAALDWGGYFGAATAGTENSVYGAIGSAITVTLAPVPPALGTVIFDTAPGLFGKTIVIGANPYVPEPGTIAIGGLGAAALLIFRRRK